MQESSGSRARFAHRASMQHSPLIRMWARGWLVSALVWTMSSASMAQQRRPMELEDMFRVKRVSDPQVSPDGARVAYVVTEVLKDENRTNADIWVVPTDGSSAPKKLT